MLVTYLILAIDKMQTLRYEGELEVAMGGK